MQVVADTNTFIAVALNEPEKDLIIRLTKGLDLVAPEILPYEIGNALTAMYKRKVLEAENVLDVWATIRKIPVVLRRIEIKTALEIATRNHIYAYDAYFLECAIELTCPLLTLDQRLAMVARKTGITVLE